jgi:hypothetical protein
MVCQWQPQPQEAKASPNEQAELGNMNFSISLVAKM